jgi:hypothetical protein
VKEKVATLETLVVVGPLVVVYEFHGAVAAVAPIVRFLVFRVIVVSPVFLAIVAAVVLRAILVAVVFVRRVGEGFEKVMEEEVNEIRLLEGGTSEVPPEILVRATTQKEPIANLCSPWVGKSSSLREG